MQSLIELFFLSMAIGVTVAAPIGPTGVLCLRRTLAEGPLAGLASGLGAATADALYSAVAGFGITFISGLLIGHRSWVELSGGLALCHLGFKIFFSGSIRAGACVEMKGILRAYISALVLTMLNPYTILFFMAAFAMLGLPCLGGDCHHAYVVILGIFAGSSSWWLVLSTGAGIFRSRRTERALRNINRLTGTLIFCAGLGAVFAGIFSQ